MAASAAGAVLLQIDVKVLDGGRVPVIRYDRALLVAVSQQAEGTDTAKDVGDQ